MLFNKVYIGLGSNLGDREQYLKRAIEGIGKELEIISISSVYESEPIGDLEQNKFLNQVVEVYTSKNVDDIFAITKEIEQKLGRKRSIKWGSRTIDIDILLFGREIIDKIDLKIPHPEMILRRFVLEPLSEIVSDIVIPLYNIPISFYLSKVQNQLVYIYRSEGDNDGV
ncbi:MAG: 2-amino-4-hydroxy-6-hydroxymethyldihydropteridine diphosphokinase [Spirochaetota bacterium]|nr:2-amino-4-hydroxy-6-hydroxymethyldihydropteridine diphosphokinase [Spirochaetota bacterium]